MKKYLVIMLLLASVMPIFAQTDTLRWRQREPTFYYWNNHWADVQGGTLTIRDVSCASMIKARRCIADSTLKVIGVAAPVSIDYMQCRIVTNLIAIRVAEYFQLYEATADSFYLVAEARYDTAHPRYRMVMHNPLFRPHVPLDPDPWDDDTLELMPYVYEAYFDKPYIVSDSFYVAVTHNNSDWYIDDNTGNYRRLPGYGTLYYTIAGACAIEDNFRIKYTNPFNQIPENRLNEETSAYRDYYLQGWTHIDPCNSTEHPSYMYLFPIFDTTGLDIHGFRWVGECDSVRNVQLLDANGNQGWAYLSWNAGQYARWWEVSYGRRGIRPEEGMRDTVQSSFVRLEGLQADSQYVVYVRERCREDTRSVWSRYFIFRMPHASEVETPQKTDVDIYTHLIPNPASGPVTVISGFRIEAVEVYTVAGTLVETIGLKANTGVIDTSRWPKGAYILRIRTSHGDTSKRLVVQ